MGSTLPVTFPYVTISPEILTYLLRRVLPLTDEATETQTGNGLQTPGNF